MGKAIFPEEDAGRGGVESSGPAPPAPSGRHFPWVPFLPPPQLPPPRKGQQSFLPSFLWEAHLSRAGSSRAATQWPLSAVEPGTETQHTPSLTYFLFPPSGSGLGPERPYPDWGQEEGEHPPFPFPPLNHCWTHPSLLTGGRGRGV